MADTCANDGAILVRVLTCPKCHEAVWNQPARVFAEASLRRLADPNSPLPCLSKINDTQICALDCGHDGKCLPERAP